jgi:hypothetical protein
MNTILYSEYKKTHKPVTLNDVLEAQSDNEYVMVSVDDRVYCITEIDLNSEESFVCIDKECNEYTFAFDQISKIEGI